MNHSLQILIIAEVEPNVQRRSLNPGASKSDFEINDVIQKLKFYCSIFFTPFEIRLSHATLQLVQKSRIQFLQVGKLLQKGSDIRCSNKSKESNPASSGGKKCCRREIQFEFELLLRSNCVRQK